MPVSFGPRYRLAELSADVVAAALGWSPGDPFLTLLARRAWVAYGLAAVGLLAGSLGPLLLKRRSERRQLLEDLRAARDPRQPGWQAAADRLAGVVGLRSVQLLLRAGPIEPARSYHFGLLRPLRVVEVSTGCIEELERAEVEALLVHELAHLRRRHLLGATLLRFLGRLSFTGDAFVLVLQHTAGYEEAADRVAARHVGRPELRRALARVRELGSADRLASSASSSGPAAAEGPQVADRLPPGGPAVLPWWRRLALGWEVFRLQYFEAMETHYWYPAAADRGGSDSEGAL
jgi:Zn-dependent protease with chaperone function